MTGTSAGFADESLSAVTDRPAIDTGSFGAHCRSVDDSGKAPGPASCAARRRKRSRVHRGFYRTCRGCQQHACSRRRRGIAYARGVVHLRRGRDHHRPSAEHRATQSSRCRSHIVLRWTDLRTGPDVSGAHRSRALVCNPSNSSVFPQGIPDTEFPCQKQEIARVRSIPSLHRAVTVTTGLEVD